MVLNRLAGHRIPARALDLHMNEFWYILSIAIT
jgi:hypothetical protein